jgi:hypothetical protein
MAKLVGPLHSDGARGAYGDVIKYSEWRGKAYAQRFRKPRNPRSASQGQQRGRMQIVAQTWAGIGYATQQTWEAYASEHPMIDPWTGQETIMPGYTWYCCCNRRLQQCGFSLVTAPPSLGAPTGLTSLTLSKSELLLQVTFAPTPLQANEHLYIWLFHSSSLGRTPGAREFAFQTFSPAAEASPFDILTGVANRVYTVAIGVFRDTDGLLSAYKQSIPFKFA